jgi:phage shock protein E
MDRIFVDVREPSEYARGHVEGAINVPPADIMSGAAALKDVDKNTELVLYCMSGARSNMSMRFLKEMGFTNLVNGINQDHVRQNYSL